MKKKILIFGSGSVGAHHANAARSLNATVFITDINFNNIDNENNNNHSLSNVSNKVKR